VKVGDLVRVRAQGGYDLTSQLGIIIDVLEQSNGFYALEVATEHATGWYSDLDLQLINESA